MPVELRKRVSRPSYAAMFELPEGEGGPALPEDASSESAFEPEAEEANDGADDSNAMLVDEREEVIIHDDESDPESAVAIISKSKGKAKAKAMSGAKTAALHRPATVILAPGLSRPNTRQFYALPLPSVNHRHRGMPLHLPPPHTLRLVSEPSLFCDAETVVTRSIYDSWVRERVTKAHNNNVGKGPVWELLEDRSWFKECQPGTQTRPIVYNSVRLRQGWKMLSSEESFPYLPSNQEHSEHSTPLACFFGPFNSQKRIELNMFDTLKIADVLPESKSHVFYAGAPVWAMDWCPISMEDLPRRNFKQYIAVAPFPSKIHSPEIGKRAVRPYPACIQIWSLLPTLPISKTSKKKTKIEQQDPGIMSCEIVLCLDSGPAHDMKWCPLPAHDESKRTTTESSPRKLGILAGTFEDGSLSLYIVPDPQSLPRSNATVSGPLFVKLEPHLRVELDDTLCWSLDWANSDLIAVGCTNGSIAVFHIREALNASDGQECGVLRPSHYIQAHQSAVRAVSWVRSPPMAGSGVIRPDRDPTVIVSGGYDGAQIVTDIRDHRGNVMNRTRDIINSIAYSHHLGGPLIADFENIIKNFSMSPIVLGRGHSLLDSSGPVLSLSTSDFHPHIAVGSADGTCLTTNTLKSTRKGGLVPFFVHKIFQMDYSRISGEFRMLENFLPYTYEDRIGTSRPEKKNAKPEDTSRPSTGAWSPEVTVTRVTWQSGSDIARAPLLASATASGLCRIDWLLGRFVNNRFPYKNVECLRGEVEHEDIQDTED